MTGVPPPTPSSPGSLSPADWAQLEALVDALLDTPPDRRAALLAEVSGGDPARRAELERLVAECESPHPLLDQPAAKRFAALVDEQAVRVSAVLGDRYQITREIGRGGMATVYLAHDIRHSRDVAVKVLRPDLAAALGGGRFLREIEIAARLRHPNIVPLYDSGWVPATETDAGSDGVLYYVMPYESGHSLRERLAQNGRLPIDDAIIILRDICDALAHAHRNGIVHRDIKPDNVLLAGRHAMVTDFGVAKALAGERSLRPAGEKPPSALTTAGVSLGTPVYMAPEQIAADPRTDHRADLYAVGVLAYELLSGRPPFHSDEPQAVLAAHLSQRPEPIATHRPDVPPVLGELVMKCLEKRPVDRWQSADDLVSRLESILSPGAISGEKVVAAAPIPADQPIHSRSSNPHLRRLIGLTAGAGVVVASIFAINRARAPVDSAPALDPRKIVIVPFRVSGFDSSMRDLGEGIVDLLSAKLNGEGGPLAVDSRTTISAWNRVGGGNVGTADQARQVARMLGAGEALFGTVVGVPGNRLTITANVIPTLGGSARPAVTVTGPVDSLPSLLDAVATRIVARGAGVTDQTLSTLTSASIPALRAYLWGRAEYRRGREREAVEHFARAIEMDSTFALAALDLVAATGQPIGMGTRCSPECLTTYFALGFRNPGPESDHRRLMHALDVAWQHRDKLSARDRPLLEALRGDSARERSNARAMIAAFQRAATAAPDRVETYYLLGSLLLFQGRAVEIVDSRSRAAAAFKRALDLDPSYVAPMAGLVEVAAFDGDTVELRRAGDLYISHDSVTGAADYVRWRVAAGTNDARALEAIRARFDSLDVSTLQRIVHASQMSGVHLTDAARATSIVVDRAADPIQRRIALGSAYMVAMNRGRPREAVDFLERRAKVVDDPLAFWTWAPMSALFWDGDSALAASTVRDRSERIARDTLSRPVSERASLELSRHISQQGLWDFMHGDTARAVRAVRWLRRNNYSPGADFLDMLLATHSRRPDADVLRSRVDSIALEGCCTTVLVHWANLVVARAHEAAGQDTDALRAVRRGVWRFPPQLLSTFLREEGRLAAKLGDREGAIRAYRHYLALRADPEPEVQPEVDRVRVELSLLERGR